MYIIGVLGAFLFLIKIIIHAIVKQLLDKTYFSDSFGQFRDFALFFPILIQVPKKLKPVKIIANIFYFIAILLIATYLIPVLGGSTKKHI